MPRLTLRGVISLLCAALVLVVGASTLAITYTFSLSALQSLGKTHALALATTARVETEAYFTAPVQAVEGIASAYLQKGAGLPSNLPDPGSPSIAEHAFSAIWMLGLTANNFSYSSLGALMDDGSGGGIFPVGRSASPPFRYFFWRSIGTYSFENRTGQMHATHRAFRVSDFQEYDNADDFATLEQNFDLRGDYYAELRALVRPFETGLWMPAGLFRLGGRTVFVFPAAIRILDSNGTYIGVTTAAVELDQISTFLLRLQTSAGTEAFVVGSDGHLVGSTHRVPYQSFEPTTRTSAAGLPSGCGLITADFDAELAASPQEIGCRVHAEDFPYAPLRAAAAAENGFEDVEASAVRMLDTSEGRFFVAVTPVTSRFRLFGLAVVLCIPEATILGDMVNGRNVAIGVTCGVLFVAVAVGFGLVYLLLQPLADVSSDMQATARLRDVDEDRPYSRLAEIRDLQRAYTQMNTAIRSFTRYVPRDVVKDLMASGQLCAIQMTAQHCTMLFCDIAGFTTVCERVPPDRLSTLVTGFFERASRIIMQHDGQIDKFIGDCIMAVWGAPFGVSNQEVKAVLAGKLVDRETMVAPLAFDWDAAGEILRVRVGVASGEVLAGNMGSAERMNYTVIGDAVNLASRLEGLNKQFDTRVMIDSATAERVTEVFVLRLLGAIAVVGRESAEEVYEVVGLFPSLSEAAAERLQFHDNDWQLHFDSLQNSHALLPDSQSQLHQTATHSVGETVSQSASLSGGGGGRYINRRAGRVPTPTLVRRAILSRGSTLPVACNDAEIAAAQHFTKATRLFLSRNFAAASDSLSLLEGTVGAQEDTKTPTMSIDNPETDSPPKSGERRRLATSMSTRPLAMLQEQVETSLAVPQSEQDVPSVVYRALSK